MNGKIFVLGAVLGILATLVALNTYSHLLPYSVESTPTAALTVAGVPSDIVSDQDIEVYPDKIVIHVFDAEYFNVFQLHDSPFPLRLPLI